MQGRTNVSSGSPTDAGRMRAWRVSSSNGTTLPKQSQNEESAVTGVPEVTLGDVETHIDIGQTNGLLQEQSPPARRPNGFQKMQSSPVLPSGLMSSPTASPEPELTPWSSAIGHAGTGKSGRVIERLQADIDRLNRDLQLLKARMNDSEKARETLVTHNFNLQDRNSNHEQFQEASLRQMQRKDRLIEDLRENVSREKQRVAAADQSVKDAAVCEETWRNTARQSQARAEQKDAEYAIMVACRNMENKSLGTSLDELRDSFRTLSEGSSGDRERCDRLQLIAEQQSQTIAQLQELNNKTNINFHAYSTEVEQVIAGLKEQVASNETSVLGKMDEMGRVTAQMKWVIAVDRGTRTRSTTITSNSSSGRRYTASAQQPDVLAVGKKPPHDDKRRV